MFERSLAHPPEPALPWNPILKQYRESSSDVAGMPVSWREAGRILGLSHTGVRRRILALLKQPGRRLQREAWVIISGYWIRVTRERNAPNLYLVPGAPPEQVGWRECMNPLCRSWRGKRKRFWSLGAQHRFCTSCEEEIEIEELRLVKAHIV